MRRVGVALRLYGLPFEHRPWSTFSDADKILPLNPLLRVPTLVLDDGDILIDSHIILDYLDSLVPEAKALVPRREPASHRVLRIVALGTGLADKAVSLFYERRMHKEVSETWSARCRTQISSVLAVLERERTAGPGAYWFGDVIGHADIAVAVALRFAGEAHPGLIDWTRYPALAAHAARLEALPLFQEISQPFIVPA